jgi:hypothetical protein
MMSIGCISLVQYLLLHLSQHYKAHKLSFSFRFKNRSQHFARTSAIWNTQTQQFSLRNQDEQRQKYLYFFVPGNRMFFILIGIRSGLRRGHSIGPPRLIHLGKLLSTDILKQTQNVECFVSSMDRHTTIILAPF